MVPITACIWRNADATPEIVQSMREYYWESVLGGNTCKRVLNKQPHLSNKLGLRSRHFSRCPYHPDCPRLPARSCELDRLNGAASFVNGVLARRAYPASGCSTADQLHCGIRHERHERFFPGGGADLWVDYWVKVNLGIEEQMRGSWTSSA